MLDYLGGPLLTMLLTALVPTFAFSMLNLRFFNRLQVLAALAVAGLSGILIFVLAQAAGWLAGFSLPALVWVLLGLGNLYLWGEKFFSEAPPGSRAARLVVPAFAVALAAACHFFSLAVFNGLLLLVLLTNVFDGLRERKRPKEGVLRPLDGKKTYEQNTRRDIKLARKPNIYLLLLESYHSAKAMQRLYGIDDGVTDELFRKHGFTLYEDVFCNTPCTLPSLSTLLTGSLLAKPEQGNMALDTLRENGYSAEFLDSGGYVFGRLARPGEYTTYEYPEKVVRLYAIFGSLFAQSRFLRKLVRNIDLFDTGGNFATVYASLGRRIKIQSDGPRIFCLHFGAEHCDCGKGAWEADGGVFAARYRPAVARAQREIRAVVELIDAHDPDSLVLAVGDHGGMRHFSIWNGNGSVNEVLKSRNVSLEEVALDVFDTRLAIRWPVPHQTAGRVMSHVNLFRYVFAALGGGDDLLQNLAPNVSVLGGQFVFVKEGKPLERIAPFRAFVDVGDFERKIASGTAGAEDYLGLAQFWRRATP